jgi:hypothetical protein
LIDFGSIHNLIIYKLEKDINCFAYPTPKFQVMIADGDTINFSGKYHIIKLNKGDYFLDIPMISIQMGSVDVVLGVQWLQSLGTMALNFQDLFMIFSLEGNKIELRGIQGKPSKVINSNSMKKLLEKGHLGVVSQLFSLYVQASILYAPLYLQIVIKNDSKVFGEILKGLPHARDHDHAIHLQPGSVPPNIRPCMYSYTQKSEIESMIQEMLEDNIIQPSQNYFYMVMVTKNDGS